MIRYYWWLLAILLFASCTQPAAEDNTLAGSALQAPATATLLPTPTLAPTIEAVATATPTPTAIPSATPAPAQRREIGEQALDIGNHGVAAEQFATLLDQTTFLDEAEQQDVQLDLGVAYLRDGRFAAATETFTQLISVSPNPDSATHFHLAEAYFAQGQHALAIDALTVYVAREPEMAAYIQPRIAEAQLVLGNRDAARTAYEAALTAPAQRLKEVANRQTLAAFYLAEGNYTGAIAQYDAIHDLARFETTKGQMRYLAGQALLLAGDEQAAYQRYQTAVNEYPRAYQSYLGLVELVEAEIPVDDYQRGLVDYFAQAYLPAIDAFDRHIAANPNSYRADTHLYRAWSYEAVGNAEAALIDLRAYALTDPAVALLEEAKLLGRVGQVETAVSTYQRFLEAHPDHEEAPFAAWQIAQLAERAGNSIVAITHYQAFANRFPFHEDSAEALFKAGWLANQVSDSQQAAQLWQQAIEQVPNQPHAGAAYIWRERLVASGQITETVTLTETIGAHYYQLRARDVLTSALPYKAAHSFMLPVDETAVQQEAEAWLRTWLNLPADGDIATLSPKLADDARRRVGEMLWQLGLLEEAKGELEELRQEYADNPLFSYQLALYFRDLGLYRSSIIAAASVLTASGETIFTAPTFLGRLIYPVYYADQIMNLAQEHGYDPRLQFALVRQESLFESFARSGAAAQGLSQVIPDTGIFIAQRLNWPNYENDDLYKPYVGLVFGAYYLDLQLDSFDNHPHAALAAYNAGPGNAARWYESAGGDHDWYLETVDFWETRQYIERIYVG
ncbi:MAG: tetratricopeptide repeat protein [Chloroflexota bacterium]